MVTETSPSTPNESTQVWSDIMANYTQPEYYSQAFLILSALAIGWLLSLVLRQAVFKLPGDRKGLHAYSKNWFLASAGKLIFPIVAIAMLVAGEYLAKHLYQNDLIVQAAERVALVWLLWVIVRTFILHKTARLICTWILVPLALLQLFNLVEPMIAKFTDIGFKIGSFNISVYAVLKGVVIIALLLALGKTLNQFIIRQIRQQQKLSSSTKELLVKLTELGMYILLFVIGLDLVGIDLTALAVFSGAIGVGLGFGLQKIASNFISGLILLSEKSVTMGDIIEMDDGVMGYMRKLGARASVVETFDGKEVMVPNEDFITSRVANLTHSRKNGRVLITIGVSYDSDLELARKLILQAAEDYESASKEEGFLPKCFLQDFADSSVNFALTFWLDDVTTGRWQAKSDVMFNIWNNLKDNHIEIPFPQRDLNIKNIPVDFVNLKSEPKN